MTEAETRAQIDQLLKAKADNNDDAIDAIGETLLAGIAINLARIADALTQGKPA